MSKFIEAAKKRAQRAEDSILPSLAQQKEVAIPIESQETQPGEPLFGPHSRN